MENVAAHVSINLSILKWHNMGHDGAVHAKPRASIDSSARLAAYELVSMAAIPSAALALARLNVFEALAQAGDDAELTASELAALALPGKPNVNVTYLARLLRMMSGMKVLREVVTTGHNGAVTERRYALEPVGRLLVDDEENGSYVNLLRLVHHTSNWQPLDHMHETVLDDTILPNARALGVVHGWEYFKRNPERNVVMNKAMAGLSKVSMPVLLDAYHGFDDVHVLVDVGGGNGAFLGLITARYPHIRGINFDQPQVVAGAPQLPGVEHVGGSMFESIPLGADTIIVKFILHDWDDESCVKILKKCYEAVPAQGKVVGIDYMVPEIINFEGADSVALQSDIHMFALTESCGRERTEREMRELGLAAGFKQVKFICKVDAMAVTEFHKA